MDDNKYTTGYDPYPVTGEGKVDVTKVKSAGELTLLYSSKLTKETSDGQLSLLRIRMHRSIDLWLLKNLK